MFNKKFFIFLICLVIHPFPVFAHAFFGKEGFYDGISHPVLGLDHLLAMICVGIPLHNLVEEPFGQFP